MTLKAQLGFKKGEEKMNKNTKKSSFEKREEFPPRKVEHAISEEQFEEKDKENKQD